MSSERLPSFKGPRDLSLSARGAKRDGTSSGQASAQARPRRVFTPNIPPKRDRVATSASMAGPKENTNASGPSRGRPPRGRGGPRGGGRPPKQRGELLQSESIFSDGVGDPMDAKRNSAMQYRSGYGSSSRYKSATEGGPSRMSSMNRTTLNTLIKEEDDESNRKIFGTEKFEGEEEDETGLENPNTPVVLPLTGYVQELFMGPTTLEVEGTGTTTVVRPEEHLTPSTSTDSGSGLISLVKVKEEKIDDDEDEVANIVKIKKEKFDDTEKEIESGSEALAAMSLESTTFAGTFRSTPPDGAIVYFQFPDELPVLEGSIRESVDQESTKSSVDLVQDIDDLSEGFIGKLQILSSGRTRFVLGENIFDVDSGRPVGFRQELLSVDVENAKLTNLGPINRKFVITPDIEYLIRDAL